MPSKMEKDAPGGGQESFIDIFLEAKYTVGISLCEVLPIGE